MVEPLHNGHLGTEEIKAAMMIDDWIFNQILSTNLRENVWRSVWRIFMLILGWRGQIINHSMNMGLCPTCALCAWKPRYKFWNLLQLSFFKQPNKTSWLTFLQQIVALLSLQVQYINFNLREIIILHVVKAAIIAISVYFNPLCGQSHSEY